MPFFLRVIRKSKWYKTADVPWLGHGELQADALADLKTASNELSVWEINDDRKNLDDVVVACACTRGHLANVDYALIGQDIVTGLGIRVSRTAGVSRCPMANQFHCDLVELTATRLIQLAKMIKAWGQIARISEKAVQVLLAKAAQNGEIQVSDMEPDLAKRIAQHMTR